MRGLLPLALAAAALAGCGFNSLQQPGANPLGAHSVADTLAGRAPGSPVSCLPSGSLWRSEVREHSLAFRSGNQIYVSTFEGDCPLGRLDLGYTLVTQQRGTGMCSGDIAKIMDPSTGQIAGICVVGPFVPYSALRNWH
jgi:hypothetical protein